MIHVIFVYNILNSNMNLLKESKTYKPFNYQWCFDAWETQQNIIWLPHEVSMTQDLMDWEINLSEVEKHVLSHIFRFFTQSDITVGNGYIDLFLQAFKPCEVRMMLVSFLNMETIHIHAYSFLMDTIGMPVTEYNAFLQYQEMVDKYNYMQNFNVSDDFNIARSLAAFGAFTEGLQLFASFAVLLNFQRFGKMKGMCQIVAWSMRDETLHTQSMCKLFRTFLYENSDLNNSILENEIKSICNNIINFEDAFIDLVFKIGNIEGLTSGEMKDYIRFIANDRLNLLGYSSIYNIEKNPLIWMNYVMGIEFTNFFENKPTEYSKDITSGSWDDVFKN